MKQLEQLSTKTALLIIGGLALFIGMAFNGQTHLFDWDEINFAEAAREMIRSNNYSMVQINYAPFWEKPPFFFWLQVLAMKVFGVNEFAARFPNAIAGVVTSITLFLIGKKHFSKSFGWLWAMVYMTSLLPLLYFKSGIIDPWFNFFIFLGIYTFWVALNQSGKGKWKWAIGSGLAIGLGIMTKGPVALLIFLMIYGVYLLVNKFRIGLSISQVVLFTLSMISIGGIWFLFEALQGRWYIIEEFITYQIRLLQTQDAGHGGPFYYHFVVLLLGCFPMSVAALSSFFSFPQKTAKEHYSLHMVLLLLFFLVLLLFSAVNTKIIHYSSLCYFPLSYFATLSLYRIYTGEQKLKTFQLILYGCIGGLLSIAFVAIPYFGNHIELLIHADWIHDDFAKANFAAENSWGALDYLTPLLLIIGLVTFYIKRDFSRHLIFMASTGLAFFLLMVLFIPKIERYTQGAAIEFFESKAKEDCLIVPYRYKSYAHLFYADKMPQTHAHHGDQSWLFSNEPTVPVYAVLKITEKEDFIQDHKQFRLLYEKNGFVFFEKIKY